MLSFRRHLIQSLNTFVETIQIGSSSKSRSLILSDHPCDLTHFEWNEVCNIELKRETVRSFVSWHYLHWNIRCKLGSFRIHIAWEVSWRESLQRIVSSSIPSTHQMILSIYNCFVTISLYWILLYFIAKWIIAYISFLQYL